MPSSAVRAFTDYDDYAATIRQGTVELTVTGRGHLTTKLIRIDLHRLWMQRYSENLPVTGHVVDWGGRTVIAFRTQPGPSLLRSGLELHPTDIMLHSPGQDYYHRSSGLADYATMSLPIEEMASVGAVLAGCDLTPPRDALIFTPPTPAIGRLQRLHAAAGELAETAPEVVADPEAARGLEQALIEAMVGCLVHGKRREQSAAQGQHAIVMRRFRRAVEENPDEPLYIPEICKRIGVSRRTLFNCCQEHLGMGPKRYLLLRRMNLVRRTLREAVPGDTSVTEIATRYGFWQLGRFAVEYQSLFGESPSARLRRQSA